MKHRILIRRDKGVRSIILLRMRSLLRKAIVCSLSFEAVHVPCELNILITDDNGIRSINHEMRDVDKPTDVLSFPMYEFTPGAFKALDEQFDPQTGLLPLGDMVLSIDRIRAQAKEFGHKIERETAYLVVHSVLHLLGYDHEDVSEDRRVMRSREEEIMKKLDLTR